MTAVLTGQADIGLAGPEACIYVYNQGKDDHPIVFGQLTKRDGSFLVGREDVPFSWELLRGRTVIGGRAGGVPEMTLEYVMRQNGIVPGTDADVDTTVQFNMMAGAFTGGNGDFVTLFEPTATEVAQAGKGYILASVGQESGEIPYTAYFASQTYIREHADAAKGVSTLDIVDDGGYNIVTVQADTVPAQLKNASAGTIAVINGNYALAAGLNISDALATENADGTAAQTYANIIAVRSGDENSPKTQALLKALKTDAVKQYIADTYNGAVVASF